MLTKQEIRQLTNKDLLEEIEIASRAYLKIRMDLEGGYEKGSHEAKRLRRHLARLKTIKHELETEESAKETKPKKTINK